jgi:hypothetical protein
MGPAGPGGMVPAGHCMVVTHDGPRLHPLFVMCLSCLHRIIPPIGFSPVPISDRARGQSSLPQQILGADLPAVLFYASCFTGNCTQMGRILKYYGRVLRHRFL